MSCARWVAFYGRVFVLVFVCSRLTSTLAIASIVQGGTPSALAVTDVDVFRHEFITQFRYSHRTTVHPAHLRILVPIADHATLYEEDKGTVFLARDIVACMQKLTRRQAAARLGSRRPHGPFAHHAMPMPTRMRS